VGDLDAEWIYGDRAERKPQARPREVNEEATLEAEAIVRDAELKAREILAAAERARSRVEAELAREQAQMAEKSKKLSEFLSNALEEVERASANGRASAHDLDELEALREELRSTE
jgi:vacuolar-type H+-ATPase subunit H